MSATDENSCLVDVVNKLNEMYKTPNMSDHERFYAIGACAAGIASSAIFQSLVKDREIDADFDATCHSAGINGATEAWERKLHRDLLGHVDVTQMKKVLRDTHEKRQAELSSSRDDVAVPKSAG